MKIDDFVTNLFTLITPEKNLVDVIISKLPKKDIVIICIESARASGKTRFIAKLLNVNAHISENPLSECA